MNMYRNSVSTGEPESAEKASILEGIGDDTVDGPKSWKELLTVRFFVYCSVIVLGITLNLVVIIVYARKLQKPSYIFLFCLSVCDLLNCLILTLDILKTADVLPEMSKHALCIAHPYLVDSGCLISAFLVLFVTINRYLQSKYLQDTLSRASCAMLVTAAVVISSVFVASPYLIVRMAKLTRLNQNERELMCRQKSSSLDNEAHHSDVSGFGVSNSRAFMLSFYGVILLVLLLAFLLILVLYIKMTLQIRKKSFSRLSKISPKPQTSEPIKYIYSEAVREIRFDETSATNSEMSITDIEELVDNTSAKKTPFDPNENEIYRKCKDKATTKDCVSMRRKSSVLLVGKRSPSKILTARYYCLLMLSLILFMFYFIHFFTYIVHYCHFTFETQNSAMHGLTECFTHSYVLCFILNPVIYSYFNRGFFRNFKRAFCCDRTQLFNSKRTSVDSSFFSV